jgi:hypothetical protein
VLPEFVGTEIGKGQFPDGHGIFLEEEGRSKVNDLILFEFSQQVLIAPADIVYPGLLPLLRGGIPGIKTFTRVPDTAVDRGACPFFEDDTTIKKKTHFAVSCLLPVYAKCFPFTDPEIKLPVYRVTAGAL